MVDKKCPENNLEACINLLRNPREFAELNKEPFDERKTKILARKGFLEGGYEGEELEQKIEERLGIERQKAFKYYGFRQRISGILYELSDFEVGDGEELRRDYSRHDILNAIREDMTLELARHVSECPRCLKEYNNILIEHMKEIIFEGRYAVKTDDGACDDFDSPELIRLKHKVDESFLGIYS